MVHQFPAFRTRYVSPFPFVLLLSRIRILFKPEPEYRFLLLLFCADGLETLFSNPYAATSNAFMQRMFPDSGHRERVFTKRALKGAFLFREGIVDSGATERAMFHADRNIAETGWTYPGSNGRTAINAQLAVRING